MTDATEPSREPAAGEDPLGPPGQVDGLGDDVSVAGPETGTDGSDASHEVSGPSEPTATGAGPAADRSGSSVEELIVDLEHTIAERDEYLDALRRCQADFENYRKRVAKQAGADAARAAEALVDKLLPVLDACDGAIAHGAAEVEPIFAALLGTLEKDGLARIDPTGEVFDPNVHEAVFHEPAEDGADTTTVSDVLRPGYSWKGRVVRPAMVKVRG